MQGGNHTGIRPNGQPPTVQEGLAGGQAVSRLWWHADLGLANRYTPAVMVLGSFGRRTKGSRVSAHELSEGEVVGRNKATAVSGERGTSAGNARGGAWECSRS